MRARRGVKDKSPRYLLGGTEKIRKEASLGESREVLRRFNVRRAGVTGSRRLEAIRTMPLLCVWLPIWVAANIVFRGSRFGGSPSQERFYKVLLRASNDHVICQCLQDCSQRTFVCIHNDVAPSSPSSICFKSFVNKVSLICLPVRRPGFIRQPIVVSFLADNEICKVLLSSNSRTNRHKNNIS